MIAPTLALAPGSGPPGRQVNSHCDWARAMFSPAPNNNVNIVVK